MFLFSPANVYGFYFAFCALIDGVEYKTGIGKSKKEARLKAAQYALEDLLPTMENVKSLLPQEPGESLAGTWTYTRFSWFLSSLLFIWFI